MPRPITGGEWVLFANEGKKDARNPKKIQDCKRKRRDLSRRDGDESGIWIRMFPAH